MVNVDTTMKILVGVSLIPIIITSIADANVSGATLVILGLIPLFLAIGMLKGSSKGK